MAAVVGVGMVVGTEAGTEAGMAAGGTAVTGMEEIGIVGAGGPAMAGAGGERAAGIPTRLGASTLTVIMLAAMAATASLPVLKTKLQRFNPGLLTSASITARSTAKLVRAQKVPSKPFRPSTA